MLKNRATEEYAQMNDMNWTNFQGWVAVRSGECKLVSVWRKMVQKSLYYAAPSLCHSAGAVFL